MKKKISILGSTGSIGVNALNVIKTISQEYEIVHLTGNANADLMIKQCRAFHPKSIVMINEEAAKKVGKELIDNDVEILSGRDNLLKISKNNQVDLVLNALVGAPGMEPTLLALNSGIDVALSLSLIHI